MRLTLYKNCKLNNKYQNVFALCRFGNLSGDKLIDKYLATLEHIVVEVDNTYQDGIGTIPLEYDSSTVNGSYSYNYMKVENTFSDGSTILRYCFIDCITVKNDICYLDYSEDIWHSYGYNNWGITKSYLSRSRLANSNYYSNMRCTPYNLPVEYDGNNGLTMNEYMTFDMFSIIVEFQWYNTAGFGQSTSRSTAVFMIEQDGDVGFTFEKTRQWINNLYQRTSRTTPLFKYMLSNGYYYDYFDIGKIWIVPYFADLENMFGYGAEYDVYGRMFCQILEGANSQTDAIFNLHSPNLSLINSIEKIDSITIANDFSLVSLGPLGKQIDIVNNGTSHLISINGLVNYDEFKLFMNVDNNFIDITDCFIFELPYDTLSSDVVQQQKMSASMRIWSSAIEIASSARTPYGMGSVDLVNVGSNSVHDRITTRSGFKNTARYVHRKGQLTSAEINKGSGGSYTKSRTVSTPSYKAIEKGDTTGSGLSSMGSSIVGMYGAIAPVYSTTKKADGISGAFANAKYFLIGYSIDSDNGTYVNECINNDGYVVYEIVTDLWKTGIKGQSLSKPYYDNGSTDYAFRIHKYNTVKFDSINIYGQFPRDVAVTLEDILENGTKVWFDYNAIQ